MKIKTIIYAIPLTAIILASFNQVYGVSEIKEENVTYNADGKTFKAFVAWNENIKGKRPAILVVPEWWGLNDYIKSRAKQLASLGYIAMAIDVFGNGKIAANPSEAEALTAPFYKDPQMGLDRLDAAIQRIKEFSVTDDKNIAAIGYCFGGAVVLNSAILGAPLKGVVSFHGLLSGVTPKKGLLKAKMLVFQGTDDKFVPQADIMKFKHEMDSIGADYTFKSFAGATHAFTNPDATRIGKKFNLPIKYDAKADKESWNDMKVFLTGLFKK